MGFFWQKYRSGRIRCGTNIGAEKEVGILCEDVSNEGELLRSTDIFIKMEKTEHADISSTDKFHF